MGLIAGEGLTSEMVSLSQAGQRFDGRACWCFLPEHLFQALDHQILDAGATPGGGNFGLFEKTVRKIDRGFHRSNKYVNIALCQATE
jgi:hypothetical protein